MIKVNVTQCEVRYYLYTAAKLLEKKAHQKLELDEESVMLRPMMKISAAMLLSGLAFAGLANAAGDPAAGAEKITVCVACHGTDGKATADIYPSLNGQSATYLDMALKAYRAGERGGGMAIIMTPQAANLSDQDIADIAAYYSQQ